MISLYQKELSKINGNEFKRISKIHGVNSWRSDDEEDEGNKQKISSKILKQNKPPPLKLSASVSDLRERQYNALLQDSRETVTINNGGYSNAVKSPPKSKITASEQQQEDLNLSKSMKDLNLIEDKEISTEPTAFNDDISNYLPSISSFEEAMTDTLKLGKNKKVYKSTPNLSVKNAFAAIALSSSDNETDSVESDNETQQSTSTNQLQTSKKKVQYNNKQNKKKKKKKRSKKKKSQQKLQNNLLAISTIGENSIDLQEKEDLFVMRDKNGQRVAIASKHLIPVEGHPELMVKRNYRIIHPRRGMEHFEPRLTEIEEQLLIRADVFERMREHALRALGLPSIDTLFEDEHY